MGVHVLGFSYWVSGYGGIRFRNFQDYGIVLGSFSALFGEGKSVDLESTTAGTHENSSWTHGVLSLEESNVFQACVAVECQDRWLVVENHTEGRSGGSTWQTKILKPTPHVKPHSMQP